MSESWSDYFLRVGGAAAECLEVVGDLVNQIEVAFHANEQRGVGILWLPKSRQAFYYSLDWTSVNLNFQRKTLIELHLANIIFGLSMWQGFILCHRAVMVREPIVKVALPQFSHAEDYQSDTKSDESVLWSIVNQLKENMFTDWSYISPAKKQQDEKFQKLDKLLRHGRLVAADSAAFEPYSLTKSNLRDTIQCVLPIIPKAYLNTTVSR